MNVGKKEKESKKIDLIFSNFVSINKNTIIINNINKVHKQNSFNNKQIDLLNEIISENDNNNKNNSTTKNILQLKQKILEGRNKSSCSNNSLNAFNLQCHTLSLNHSSDHLNKNKKKNSIIINGKTMNSILKSVRNKSPSNNHITFNKICVNSSFPIKRKATDINQNNQLLFSSIIIPSNIHKKYNMEINLNYYLMKLKKKLKN